LRFAGAPTFAKVRMNISEDPRHYRMTYQIRHAERPEGLDETLYVWTFA
jgi:hypothetical protein